MQGYIEKKAAGNASISKQGTAPDERAVVACKVYDSGDGAEQGEEDFEYTEANVDAQIAATELLLLDLEALRTDVIATLA